MDHDESQGRVRPSLKASRRFLYSVVVVRLAPTVIVVIQCKHILIVLPSLIPRRMTPIAAQMRSSGLTDLDRPRLRLVIGRFHGLSSNLEFVGI